MKIFGIMNKSSTDVLEQETDLAVTSGWEFEDYLYFNVIFLIAENYNSLPHRHTHRQTDRQTDRQIKRRTDGYRSSGLLEFSF